MNVEETLLQRIAELEKTVSALSKQNEGYKALIASKGLREAKQDYKDRLFKFIFGNPENKQWTLSLYNAINITSTAVPYSPFPAPYASAFTTERRLSRKARFSG